MPGPERVAAVEHQEQQQRPQVPCRCIQLRACGTDWVGWQRNDSGPTATLNSKKTSDGGHEWPLVLGTFAWRLERGMEAYGFLTYSTCTAENRIFSSLAAQVVRGDQIGLLRQVASSIPDHSTRTFVIVIVALVEGLRSWWKAH